MIIFLAFSFLLTILVGFYAIWGRKWLKAKTWPWSMRFFAAVEPVEILLWGKSETILWSRFLQLMGGLYALLTWLGALDVTPFLILMPDSWRPWVTAAPFAAVVIGGIVQEILRRGTSQPLELVAVSDNASVEVKLAIHAADVVKKEAMAVVVESLNEAPPTVKPDKE